MGPTRINWRQDVTSDADWDYGYDPIWDSKRAGNVNQLPISCLFSSSPDSRISELFKKIKKGKPNGCKLNYGERVKQVCAYLLGSFASLKKNKLLTILLNIS